MKNKVQAVISAVVIAMLSLPSTCFADMAWRPTNTVDHRTAVDYPVIMLITLVIMAVISITAFVILYGKTREQHEKEQKGECHLANQESVLTSPEPDEDSEEGAS